MIEIPFTTILMVVEWRIFMFPGSSNVTLPSFLLLIVINCYHPPSLCVSVCRCFPPTHYTQGIRGPVTSRLFNKILFMFGALLSL